MIVKNLIILAQIIPVFLKWKGDIVTEGTKPSALKILSKLIPIFNETLDQKWHLRTFRPTEGTSSPQPAPLPQPHFPP